MIKFYKDFINEDKKPKTVVDPRIEAMPTIDVSELKRVLKDFETSDDSLLILYTLNYHEPAKIIDDSFKNQKPNFYTRLKSNFAKTFNTRFNVAEVRNGVNLENLSDELSNFAKNNDEYKLVVQVIGLESDFNTITIVPNAVAYKVK